MTRSGARSPRGTTREMLSGRHSRNLHANRHNGEAPGALLYQRATGDDTPPPAPSPSGSRASEAKSRFRRENRCVVWGGTAESAAFRIAATGGLPVVSPTRMPLLARLLLGRLSCLGLALPPPSAKTSALSQRINPAARTAWPPGRWQRCRRALAPRGDAWMAFWRARTAAGYLRCAPPAVPRARPQACGRRLPQGAQLNARGS